MDDKKQEKILARIHLDENSGHPIKFFRTNNLELCRYVFLNDKTAKRIAAYTSIDNDLINSSEAFSHIKYSISENKNYSNIILKSLLINAVVTYMKCFTISDGRKIRLEKFIINDQNHLKTHEMIAEIRHQYFAHSGNSKYEMLSIIAVLSPDMENKRILTFDVALNTMQNINNAISECIDLVEFVRIYVRQKINQLWKLLKEETEKMDINKFYANSSLPNEEYFIYAPVDIRPWVKEYKYEFKIETITEDELKHRHPTQ